MSVKYPTKIKSVITKLTQCTQKALQSRRSRIQIELPPAVDYGIETNGKQKQAKSDDLDLVKRSNREAARLLTEMFAILGPTTVVLFPSEAEAQVARNLWGSKFKGQVLSIDVKAAKGMGNLRSRRFSAQEQEAALLGSDGLYVPDGTEVLLVAGPRAKDARKIIKLHEKFGEATFIALINARLDAIVAGADSAAAAAAEEVDEIFDNAFHYAPPVLSTAGEFLVYHEFGEKWYVAEKPKKESGGGIMDSVGSMVGQMTGKDDLVTRWEGDEKPTQEQIMQATSS
ncbi:hypothetical protein B484DRAFT_326124 [Ochromonadaceae sp. CCMP2298]|nr:hypothetical protein B484DRAFT_326124 [Ochromonadaceae sp. CCMP2298]